MKKNEQYRVDNDKEVIFTGIYPGDTIINEATAETWIVDMYKPYVAGDRTLRSLILGAYVIPYAVGTGGGSVVQPAGPRVLSSGLNTDISDVIINVLLSESAEATCPVTGQIDVSIDGVAGTVPLSVIIDASDDRRMQITLPAAISLGQDVKWTYNPGGSCLLQGLTVPSEPMEGGTYSVLVSGTAHVYPFNVIVETSDHDYEPYHVEGGTLTKTHLSGTRYRFTSTDPIDAIQFGKMYQVGDDSLTEIEIIKYTPTSSCKNMLADLEVLHTVDLSGLDTSNVTDMSFMFNGCSEVHTLDLHSFDTSKVINMSGMFFHCEILHTLNVSSFNVHNVKDMSFMFNDCDGLLNLDLTSFHMNKVETTSRMFEACRHLICLTNVDTSKITDPTKRTMMFDNCHDLVAPDATAQTAIEAGTHWTNSNACP